MTDFDNNDLNERENSLNENADSLNDTAPAQEPDESTAEAVAPEEAHAANETFSAQQPDPQPRQTTPPPAYQQNPYYNPYQQQYNQQGRQSYPQQPSQGYYRPDTNEYVYSPTPPKKKSGAGKAAIIALVCVLSVFVVGVAAASFIHFVKGIADIAKNGIDDNGLFSQYDDQNDESSLPGKNKGDKPSKPDKDNADPDSEAEDLSGESSEAAAYEPVEIRSFPTLEQLAAPEDAMSLPDIYDKLSQSVVGISCPVQGGTQTGTGFIISEDGYIVTNAHVIDGAKSIKIVDGDLNEYEAEVIGSDTQTDIAVLRIDPDEIELVPVEFGRSGDLRIGELTVAIGNPLGFDLYGTMTTGIVSGLNRTVTISDNTMNLLQTSASINHGNSGGPLIDAYGRVIGITSAKIDSTYGEGLGFAIPIDEALPIIENLVRYGYVPGRPALGVSGQDVTDMISMFYNLPKGVYVFFVTEGSGAEEAGIIPGDVIIGIQGETITSMDELNTIKNNYAVGDTVTLTIYRKGQNFDVQVRLTESHPDN